MALSCLPGAPLGSRASGPGTAGSVRAMKEGAESEGGLRRATPSQPSSGPEKVLASAGSGQGVPQSGGVSSLVGPSVSLPLPLFSSQQAAVAAGLFGASMGSLAHGSLRLPALMASLQAAAGVGVGVGVLPLPMRPNSGLPLMGHGGGFPSGPLFPSISQHNALLTWTKLAQSNAGLGVDVSQGGIMTSMHHSPDISRPPSSKSYSGGGGGGNGRERIRESSKLDKQTRARGRDVKERRIDFGRRDKKIDLHDQTKSELEPEPEASSPAGTSSPPSNGSSGGKSAESGRKSRGTGETGRDKVFSCSICHRTFGYKHVLQNHERTHTGEKPFECKQCGKRFTRDHHLKTHMRLHTGEKPYNCTHCDRQFVQVANLRRHLRVHTGERPYACELCTSRFSDSNQLKAHMLIHKGEKPFACQHCSGRFRRRHHLVHHKCPKDVGDGGILHSKRARPLIMADEDDIEEEPPGTPPSYSDELMETEDTLERPSTVASTRSRSRSRSRTPSVITDPIPVFPSQPEKKRGRKPRETRRFVRLDPSAGLTGPTLMSNLPEQTEPEDLSMASGSLRTEVRVRHPSTFSASSTSGWSITGSISDRIGGLASEEEEVSSDNEIHAPQHRGLLLMEAPGPVDLVRSRKPT